MSATEETFNPTALQRSETLNSTITVASKTVSGLNPKSARPQNHPRIDFEALYNNLKELLSHNWGTYHDAVTRFIRGELSADEFGDQVDHFLVLGPTIEHAHNNFICAIIYNAIRDVPDPGTAAWVSAAVDKAAGAVTSKPTITSDAAEQRLKNEIKQLPRRDRVRIKGVATEKTEDEILASRRNAYEEQYQANRIRAPDNIPSTAGGLTKTNWELEIKKRYQLPLFSETVEFPDAAVVFARMVPICYEEAVASGSSMQAAEYVGIASEIFIKDLLGGIFNRTRANGPRYENTTSAAGEGILTGSYKTQVEKEEAESKAQRLQMDKDTGLLPVEAKAATTRKALGINDLKLAGNVVRGLWTGMPMIGRHVSEASLETEQEEWRVDRALQNEFLSPVMNDEKVSTTDVDVEMSTDLDDVVGDWGWEGTGAGDSLALGALLEDCLAIRT